MDTNQTKFQEEQIREWSQEFLYPPTPDIAGAIGRRLGEEIRPRHRSRMQLVSVGVVIVIMLIVTLLAVPSVRAQVLEFLQIGAVRIFLNDPTPTVTPEDFHEGIGSYMAVTATPLSKSEVFPSINDLAGETTLDEAQSELNFPILLPSYPPNLGAPNRVFLQDFEGPAVLLVWMDPQQPERIRMNLLILSPGTFAQKGAPKFIKETLVNGQHAIWTEGRHFLHLGGSMYQEVTLVVEGNILVWEQDGLTYRLETNLSLEEAVKMAESLE